MSGSGEEQVNMGYVAAIVAVATIGGFMFGYDSGVINGTVEGLKKAFNSNSIDTGFNVASILLGCAAGAFSAARLADIMGRRNVMMIAALLFILSAIMTGAAHTSTVFVIGRLIGGLAVGAASVLSPAYISEVTPASIRGRLSSVQQIMIISGLTGAFLGNYLIAHHAGGSTEPFWLGFEAWRWMFWAQIIPASLFFLALLIIPESPRYLVVKGRHEEAKAVLTRLFGPAAGAAKVLEIRESLAQDQHKPKLSDLLDKATGKVRPIVWVGIGLAVFQQLVGINVVFYYGAVLWQAVGFSEADALRINILSGSLSILGCLASMALVDKLGRKPLLAIGSAGMAITLGILVICFASGSIIDGKLQLSDNMGLIALISANAYAVLFNFSWGPVMWVMLGEMFPNQIRGSGLAVSGFAQWTANFGITMTFPIMLTTIGLTGAYGFYAFFALISFFFVRAMVHETKGRELEKMEG